MTLSVIFQLGDDLRSCIASLQHPEDFFLCLLVGHPFLHKRKDQLIHERIQFGEFACVHS